MSHRLRCKCKTEHHHRLQEEVFGNCLMDMDRALSMAMGVTICLMEMSLRHTTSSIPRIILGNILVLFENMPDRVLIIRTPMFLFLTVVPRRLLIQTQVALGQWLV